MRPPPILFEFTVFTDTLERAGSSKNIGSPMPTRDYDKLPFLDKEAAVFERLAFDWVRAAVDPNAEHIGAAGKGDKGCDIRARVDGKVICYQVKRRKELPLAEAKVEIQKLLDHWQPDEIVFICACDIQTDVRLKTAAFADPTPCTFLGRTEFESRLWEYPRLIEQYFGPLEKPTQAPLWSIPQRVRFFTGRDTVLQELRQALTDTGQAALGQSLAVSGLGGIGKTQTAIAYAHQYRDAYTFAFWIAAENETTLRASFSEIAGILELPEVHEPEEDRMLAAVLRAWASREGGLLVFDNVEDPDLVKRFTPNPQTHHVVVTSRLQTLRRYGFPLLELPVLAPGDAVRFLHERTGREVEEGADEHQAAVDLAEELGYLPLALEQAAAYIDTRGMGFRSYLATYRKAGVEWIDRLEAVDHPESVLKTWTLNLQQVEEESPHSIQLFHILAFLAPDDVPEFLFEDVEGVGQPLEGALAEHDAALDDLLEPLRRFSLIERDREDASISVHRLVQDVTRWVMPEDVQRDALRQTAVLLERSFPDPKKLENWEVCEQLFVHGQSLELKSLQRAENFPEAAWLFHGTALYCQERGRYQEAEPLYNRSLRIKEATLGHNHPSVAQTLNNLANLHRTQGRYEQAEPLYTRSLRISEAALGNDHPHVAQTLNNLALFYSDQGLYEEAEPLYTRSLGILESALGHDHPYVAYTLNNLAAFYSDLGRCEEAELLYTRSLRTKESALGHDHPSVASTLNNLALLYSDQGRYEEAEPLYPRAIKIYMQSLGPGHPSTPIFVQNYENLLRKLDRNDEADALRQEFNQALVAQEPPAVKNPQTTQN